QLQEVLADTERMPADTSVIVAGDMNFDTTVSTDLVQSAGFCDALGVRSEPTTPRRKFFHAGRAIDRVLVGNWMRVEDIAIHRSVEASDHYPVSFNLRLR